MASEISEVLFFTQHPLPRENQLTYEKVVALATRADPGGGRGPMRSLPGFVPLLGR